MLARALAEGRVEDEGWRLRKDGTRFWADVILTPVHDEDGAHVGFAKVTRDMTAQREAEAERLKLARAEAAVRIRDEFISVAAHELRTPLQALHVGLLALKVLMQPERFAANGVQAGAARVERLLLLTTRLGELITRLLDTSRLTRGALSLERERVDLVACARAVIAATGELGAARGRTIRLRGAERAEGWWDPLRIEQVLSNLLDNAIKYGGSGAVDVEVTAGAGRVVVRVCDDGPGIPPEHRERVFERFARVSTASQNSGLGLGLHISREIVKAHGGTLAIEDSPRGACLRLELPTGETTS